MRYVVSWTENHKYEVILDASSPEEAEKKVASGDYKYDSIDEIGMNHYNDYHVEVYDEVEMVNELKNKGLWEG